MSRPRGAVSRSTLRYLENARVALLSNPEATAEELAEAMRCSVYTAKKYAREARKRLGQPAPPEGRPSRRVAMLTQALRARRALDILIELLRKT